MENGEKREVIQENLVVTGKFLNEESLAVPNTNNSFYGGTDLRISRIRVISNNPIVIE